MSYVTFVGYARSVPLFVIEWFFMFFGVVGNILVIILIAFYNGLKKPVNKILFINLAVADLGVLLIRHSFLFLELYHIEEPGNVYNMFTCKVLQPISMMFIPTSLLIIITISYYRYQGIVQLGLSELSVKKALFIVGAIWTVTSSVYPLRRILSSKLVTNNATRVTSCQHTVPKLVGTAVRLTEIAIFLIFALVTFVLFLRMRRTIMISSKFNSSLSISLRMSQNLKTLRVLKPVIVVLFVTVSPISSLDILRIVRNETKEAPAISFKDYLLIYHISAILLVINSSANPLIYAFASREFRVSFERFLKFRWTRRHRVTSRVHSVNSTNFSQPD